MLYEPAPGRYSITAIEVMQSNKRSGSSDPEYHYFCRRLGELGLPK
jgi:hypothetical protein